MNRVAIYANGGRNLFGGGGGDHELDFEYVAFEMFVIHISGDNACVDGYICL